VCDGGEKGESVRGREKGGSCCIHLQASAVRVCWTTHSTTAGAFTYLQASAVRVSVSSSSSIFTRAWYDLGSG
jgi:hypothetical protein